MPASSHDPFQTFDPESLAWLGAIVRDQRQAALATLADGAPSVSMVAAVAEPGWGSLLLHLSELAAHKRNLRADPRCSLLLVEPGDGPAELLQRRRVALDGTAELLDKESADYAAAKACYLTALPRHAMMFGLADFDLVRVTVTGGLLNAGFGQAYRVTPEDLAAAAEAASATG